MKLIHKITEKMRRKEKAYTPFGAQAVQAGTGHEVMRKFPQIAEIKEITGFKDLPLGNKRNPTLLVEDFEHGDIDLYVREGENAELECEIGKPYGLKGKGLKIRYSIKPMQEHRGVDISRKFILEGSLRDWSAYTHLNVVVKVQQVTSLLRVCIVERDGDWWNFINNEIFEPDVWYWVRIPMRTMYVLEDFSIKGDGKQDLTQVAEMRFLFDGTNIGQNPLENTVCLDCVFLSR